MNNNYEKNYNLYKNNKRKIFYWFSGFLVLCSIFFVIPNLSKDLKDYERSVGIFKNARINITEGQKGFSTIKNSELIITMQNGREWTFDEQFEQYWNEIGDSNNKGKIYVIYTRGLTDSNPSQVEIEHKIIYDLRTLDTSKYVILILTLIFSILSVIDYRKYSKEKI